MPKIYGRTKEEVRADAIAKALVAVLVQIEKFSGDPNLILESAKIHACFVNEQGARDALRAIYNYYNEGE